MTEELKTLKDIPVLLTDAEGGCCSNKDLRQEAIKWVKELEKEYPMGYSDGDCYHEPIISWIKTFFNLTEEDLK